MKITFIGLGIMGSRMAANLLKNDVELTVHNRSEEPLNELSKKGAKAATGFRPAVENADVVFTMLSKPEVVEEVMFGENGCLSSMKKNALWVDCSTVNPSFSVQSEKEAAKHKVRFADAPVAGSKNKAEDATLTFLVGGSESDFQQIKPLLNYMGEKIKHVGKTGNGTSMKMLINAMLAESMLVFAETLALGEKMGIPRDFLLDTLPNLPVIAPFVQAKAELIRKEDFEPHFPLEWMLKDLHLVLKTAEENGFKIEMTQLTKDLYEKASKQDLGRKDFSAIYSLLKKK